MLITSCVRPRVRDTPQALSIEYLADRLVYPLCERSIVPIVCGENRLKFVSPF